MPEDRELPHFVLDGLQEDERNTLESLYESMKVDPEFAGQSLDAYFDNPEATDRMLDLFSDHPEGVGMFLKWQSIVKNRVDLVVRLDPVTEEEVENDTYYKAAKNDFQRTGEEMYRTQMRKRRMAIFISKLKDKLRPAA